MRVVAIDAAPGKASTMYQGDGCFREISGEEMRRTLHDLETLPALLCWDAPLTGPRDPDHAGRPGDFTQRRLEKFFMRKETRFETPLGISVRPYSGCPHWTISRSVLGLPRLGPYDAAYECLPFRLLPDGEGEIRGAEVAQMDRSCVVEIHPAVAAWLWWCKDAPELQQRSGRQGGGWKYKDDPLLRDQLWEVVVGCCDGVLKESLRKPENDDQFDAAIGYILGVKWLRGDADVVLLGDRENGAMLLPRTPDLCEAWEKFRKASGDHVG